MKRNRSPKIPASPPDREVPLADPKWLAGAVLIVLCLAAVCVYGTICLLFWQGQWQLVFHPSRTLSATPAQVGLRFEDVRFDATDTGVLQLDGWWIPADPGAERAGDTILFLHDGWGSLSDCVGQLKVLHSLGVNLFAFDYRGFGSSAKAHPSEARTQEDAEAAWRYLTEMRHLQPQTIAIYGVGLGAAIGAQLALHHQQAVAMILDQPRPPVLQQLRQKPRMRWLPLRLIFQDRFDPRRTLSTLALPKIFIGSAQSSRGPLYYSRAAPPKVAVTLSSQPYRDPQYPADLSRFLDEFLPSRPAR